MRYPEEPRSHFSRKTGNHLHIVQSAVYTGNSLLDSIVNRPPSDTDPQGSYTGLPLDEYEQPVQDADDL